MARSESSENQRGMGETLQENLPVHRRRDRRRIPHEYRVSAGCTCSRLPCLQDYRKRASDVDEINTPIIHQRRTVSLLNFSPSLVPRRGSWNKTTPYLWGVGTMMMNVGWLAVPELSPPFSTNFKPPQNTLRDVLRGSFPPLAPPLKL